MQFEDFFSRNVGKYIEIRFNKIAIMDTYHILPGIPESVKPILSTFLQRIYLHIKYCTLINSSFLWALSLGHR